MYYVYAIKSVNHNWIYVGISNNVQRRLSQHNKGYNKSTKHYKPFLLIYAEEFNTRINARKKEVFLKSTSGKRFLYKLIEK